MGTSFEFLAAFEEWEAQCRQNFGNMDRCPFPADGDSFERRTAHAELLKTLTALSGELKNAATDGTKDGVRGYPGIVQKSCGFGAGDSWKDWLLPTPDALRPLPQGSCLIKVKVVLESPFFSRDDRSFYPTDNVLKRHHVFLTPYLAASGLKGLLRWAWRMSGGGDTGAAELFGTAADEPGGDSRQGLLYLWPVYWNGTVGLDVINPQHRTGGAGTMPIKYEVVLPKSSGSVCLLLVNRADAVPRLLPPLWRAFRHLVDCGGLSAKNSAGWGQVSIAGGAFAVKGLRKPEQAAGQAGADKKAARWQGLLDDAGELIPFEAAIFTKKRLELLGITTQKFKKTYKGDARAAYEAIREKAEWKSDCAAPSAAAANADDAPKWYVETSLPDTFLSAIENCIQEMEHGCADA